MQILRACWYSIIKHVRCRVFKQFVILITNKVHFILCNDLKAQIKTYKVEVCVLYLYKIEKRENIFYVNNIKGRVSGFLILKVNLKKKLLNIQ